jgi:hypothetical protein
MVRAVLAKTRLEAQSIFFVATHTHTGPGGWGRHPLEQLIAGSYRPDYFNRLTGAMADAVMRSRSNLADAEVALVTVRTPPHERQINRIDEALPAHEQLSGLFFRKPGGDTLAALVVYGAHATGAGHEAVDLHADYPGGVVKRLTDSGLAFAMFGAGAVGDSRPRKPQTHHDRLTRATMMGEDLADRLLAAIDGATWHREVSLAALRLPVDLPRLRVHVARDWRLSPIATRWLHADRTHLHVVRIGPAMLLGMPGDSAGLLAEQFIARAADRPWQPVVTSFNGDYIGYLMPRNLFDEHWTYETRVMNFFGPAAGPYLNDVALQMMRRCDAATDDE